MGKRAEAPLSLYIHIPFCHARCGYCDFVTFTDKEDQRDAYIASLCREIDLYAPARISTIFFGGGTPSVLEPAHIQALFKTLRSQFTIDPSAEITLEANPESLTEEKANAWRAAGINRLSIGLQAYDDALLKSMGRLHSVAQFEAAYALARRADFSNINIDLIYGFPDQSLDSWKRTVTRTAILQPEHISLYALKVEEHTPFGVQGVRTDDDAEAEMYDWARAYLPVMGYPQYEISNFARPGKTCEHNLIYWRGQDYLGLGVGAVGCVGGTRWDNEKNLASYYKAIQAGQRPRLREEILDAQARQFEQLMLGLRLREGMAWPQDASPESLAQRAQLASRGYLEELTPGTWRIADPYVPLTNQILLPFLGV